MNQNPNLEQVASQFIQGIIGQPNRRMEEALLAHLTQGGDPKALENWSISHFCISMIQNIQTLLQGQAQPTLGQIIQVIETSVTTIDPAILDDNHFGYLKKSVEMVVKAMEICFQPNLSIDLTSVQYDQKSPTNSLNQINAALQNLYISNLNQSPQGNLSEALNVLFRIQDQAMQIANNSFQSSIRSIGGNSVIASEMHLEEAAYHANNSPLYKFFENNPSIFNILWKIFNIGGKTVNFTTMTESERFEAFKALREIIYNAPPLLIGALGLCIGFPIVSLLSVGVISATSAFHARLEARLSDVYAFLQDTNQFRRMAPLTFMELLKFSKKGLNVMGLMALASLTVAGGLPTMAVAATGYGIYDLLFSGSKGIVSRAVKGIGEWCEKGPGIHPFLDNIFKWTNSALGIFRGNHSKTKSVPVVA